VQLRFSREEVEAAPEYLEERPPRPGERWEPPPGYTISDLLGRIALLLGAGANAAPRVAELENPPDEHQIVTNAPVLAGDEIIGEISRVIYEPGSGRVRALVLHHDSMDDDLLLPAEMVESVGDDAVQVRLPDGGAPALERFRP
jgi:hypothetical protein